MEPGHRIITDWWQVGAVVLLVGFLALHLWAVISQAKADARKYIADVRAARDTARDRQQVAAEERAAREVEAIVGPVV